MKNKNISVTSNENWCWVYLIRSKKYNETYIGSTNDLSRRLFEHNDGTEISTKRYRPWQLVYYEAYRSEKDAREREMKLKSHGNAVRELKKRIQRRLKNDKRGLPSTIFRKNGASKGFTQHHFLTKNGERALPSTIFRKNGAGFTFIELVIVILLIGILVAAIGPRILHLQDSFKVEAAAEQIANHIRLAQSLAIARHETSGVGFDTGGNLYSVYDQAGNAVTDPLKGGSYSLWGINFNTHEQLKGVTIESTTLAGAQVDFNALGKPTAGGGSILIQKGSSNQLRIGVAAETGAISIW